MQDHHHLHRRSLSPILDSCAGRREYRVSGGRDHAGVWRSSIQVPSAFCESDLCVGDLGFISAGRSCRGRRVGNLEFTSAGRSCRGRRVGNLEFTSAGRSCRGRRVGDLEFISASGPCRGWRVGDLEFISASGPCRGWRVGNFGFTSAGRPCRGRRVGPAHPGLPGARRSLHAPAYEQGPVLPR